jgi:ribosomal protein S18 acetylase RimI-like enzyme
MLTLAGPADLPEAVALVNMSYRGDAARQGWTHEADYIDGERTSVASLSAELAADPQARLYLWRDDPGGPLLGCFRLEPHHGGAWHLGMLTVRPDLQARGLGRRMLEQAEAIVREAGGGSIRMTVVHVRDALIAWYGRRGYQPTGETEPFPAEAKLDLHFVVLEKRL